MHCRRYNPGRIGFFRNDPSLSAWPSRRRYSKQKRPLFPGCGNNGLLICLNGSGCGREEKGRAMTNIVAAEVNVMLSTVWLVLGTLLYSLQLNTGSFPRPLSESEEQHYLDRAKAGDLEARNILIERNLRLVAHIMKKG